MRTAEALLTSCRNTFEPKIVTIGSGWLRADMLGATEGIVSVSSLVVGVATADPSRTVCSPKPEPRILIDFAFRTA